MDRVLAVDLGGTWLRAALVDLRGGRILARQRCATPLGGPEPLLEAIDALIARLAAELADHGGDPIEPDLPIGLACPGPLDPDSGTTDGLPNLPGFADFPLAARVTSITGRYCRLHNDASLAALGEAWLGAGRGYDPLLYVTWSTGIGGGIVLDGRLFGGAKGLAGEIGHLVTQDGGPRCALGHAGCAEGIGSGSGIARRARARLAQPDGEGVALAVALREAGAAAPDAVDARTVSRAALAGDPTCRQLMREAARATGLALAGAVNLIDPARIVIGGGVARGSWSQLMPELQRSLAQSVLAWDRRAIDLVPAALGDDAGLLGAARLLALERGTA
ncbi:MAG: ROK family protein [Chloroflexi bacterium]|nr:ROK family protein [Chloroflexota bacterium]